MLNYEFFSGITRGLSPAEGLKRVHQTLVEGLTTGQLSAKDVPSFQQLGIWLGALDSMDIRGSWQRIRREVSHFDTEDVPMEHIHDKVFTESNSAVMSQAFATITGQLISSKVMEAYTAVPSVADTLMTNMPGQRLRNQRLAGLTHIGGGFDDINEAHPYPETDFSEKYIVTSESKHGGMLSITEELLTFDQTGEIYRRAGLMGEALRNKLERTKIRGVTDQQDAKNDGSSIYVWRPSGTGETLYATDGSNLNYIGSGGVSGFNAASPLVDYSDLDLVRTYRATKVVDDRIDGTARAIGGINSNLTILVPEKLRSVANNIVYPSQMATVPGSSAGTEFYYQNPLSGFISRVVSSPYVDEINGDDYYVGDFAKQFLWTEVWPVQTFIQGANSESAFGNDVILRVKARYFGGLSALDSRWVTKVDGA